MKKKILLLMVFICTITLVTVAYTSGTLVKHSDSCGRCKPNGPEAFWCGQCGRGFATVRLIQEGDEYDVYKFSHEGHHEYEECHHSMTARYYK